MNHSIPKIYKSIVFDTEFFGVKKHKNLFDFVGFLCIPTGPSLKKGKNPLIIKAIIVQFNIIAVVFQIVNSFLKFFWNFLGQKNFLYRI